MHSKQKALGKYCLGRVEDDEADKIKYPNEKVVFTSSDFRAQSILGSLSL